MNHLAPMLRQHCSNVQPPYAFHRRTKKLSLNEFVKTYCSIFQKPRHNARSIFTNSRSLINEVRRKPTVEPRGAQPTAYFA